MITKYQSVEKTKVLSEEEQAKVASKLSKLGKTSAKELSSDERTKVFNSEVLD